MTGVFAVAACRWRRLLSLFVLHVSEFLYGLVALVEFGTQVPSCVHFVLCPLFLAVSKFRW